MKGHICNGCGAEIKKEKEPEHCPICHKKSFSEREFPNPDKHDEYAKKKYDEALEILDKYEEGTIPRKLHDHGCGCGSCKYDK
ncbi:hypothetical protein K9L67_02310 [Candidatus Woesearchaeota archaeon]|nr:hypothetical protein [Candidatus Woesearchaeota archaeon]MCF7901038.1 hypothetical protein [Candidatus Woesearchaeota archaeon]MCF8013381.1 hypothetical protein [Candidatus Woesearchaeota archaeon]